MPRAKKKTAKKAPAEETAEETPDAPEPKEDGRVVTKDDVGRSKLELLQDIIYVEEIVERKLPVTIRGSLLVAKPVDPEVAVLLSPYSPVPPKAGGKWTDREKAENKKRERQRWKIGKKGHYEICLGQLKLSSGRGYGIPSNAIMRAIQTANRIMPNHMIPEELLNVAVDIPPYDVPKSLLRVTAKKGPFMKEDVVRVGHKPENPRGTPSLTVRPAWLEWKISFDVIFVQNLIDGRQVFNLLRWAGRAGILEGRPSKGSALNWGTFTVESGNEELLRRV